MRIAKLDLNQLNIQLDRLEHLHKRISKLEETLDKVRFQTSQLDFTHARPTFNNIVFTWTGGTGTISWTKGWLKDKNAVTTDTGGGFSQGSSFRFESGVQTRVVQNIAILAGSISSLTASSYYWFGWNTNNNQMYALKDITKLITQTNIQIICQLFTGTAGQTGTAGGGGSQSGSDLSGARYKLF